VIVHLPDCGEVLLVSEFGETDSLTVENGESLNEIHSPSLRLSVADYLCCSFCRSDITPRWLSSFKTAHRPSTVLMLSRLAAADWEVDEALVAPFLFAILIFL